MKLEELLSSFSYQLIAGNLDTEIAGLSKDTRKVKPGDLFILTAGTKFDTHDEAVIRELYEKGVRSFVAQKDIVILPGMTVIRVDSTRIAGAYIYASFYRNPAKHLTIIGITGSKGKTTCAHMAYSILKEADIPVGIIGTNGVAYRDIQYEIANTTPDYDELQKTLREMVDAGITHVVLEVSSQAVKLHRVTGITFQYGIFLNIQEGDHIGPNEHESFEDYLQCKAEVLNHSVTSLLYGDDPHFRSILPYVKKETYLFGESEKNPITAEDIQKDFSEKEGKPGFWFTAKIALPEKCPKEEKYFVLLPGTFNALNCLPAVYVAYRLGISPETIRKALAKLKITGRDEIVYQGEKFSICVDFAHNGASAFHHLSALRDYHPLRLVCVFGADGNRSKGRRYGMGEAAGKLADFSIVTSGHNRYETFEAILEDIEIGLKKAEKPNYIAIKDREEAIRYAIKNAQEGDLITVIGLGHEHWQEEMGQKRYYNDKEFILQVLKEEGIQ